MLKQFPKPISLSKVTVGLIPLVVIILALTARLLPGPRTIDDSFITYRYAQNILAGNGFVYNPGERVLGTTTPLYTLLLVLFGSFAGGSQAPFVYISLIINAVADSLTCLLLLNIGRRLGSPRAGLGAALVWAVAPFSVTFAIGGLETSLYVLLLTATIRAHLSEHHIPAASMGALALLTRPDALILLVPLALDRLWQIAVPRRNSPSPKSPIPHLPEVLAFALPIFAWIIFSTSYFGSPLPHSITAKSLAYRLPPEDAFVRLLQHYATPFLENLTFGISAIAIGLVLYPFLYIIGARQSLRVTPRVWPFLIYPWLYFATFSAANPLIFRWYLTPPLPAYFLTILVGIDSILRNIFKSIQKKLQQKQTPTGVLALRNIYHGSVILFVIISPLFLTIRGWTLHPDHGVNRPAPQMAWYQLELLYRQAANSLSSEIQSRNGTPPLLAAGDVGVLGFYTQARILDTVGLNSPQAIQYYPADPMLYAINYAIPPDLILDFLPDYIVILEVYGRLGLLKAPRFRQNYQLRQNIPTDIYGSEGMLIFERVDASN